MKNLVQTYIQYNDNPANGINTIMDSSFEYDLNTGKPTLITKLSGENAINESFAYDEYGNVKTHIYPNQLKEEYFYDASGAFLEKKIIYNVKDADNKTSNITTQYQYNFETGLKEYEIDPRGFKTSYEYDGLNRITKITLPDDDGDPSNNPNRQYIFDDLNNTCRLINELGQETLFSFDRLGRLTEIDKFTDSSRGYPAIIKTTYEYDPMGRIIKVTDPREFATGNIDSYSTWYEYDGVGRVTKVIFPDETPNDRTDNPYVTLQYDVIWNSVTITDENGGQVTEWRDSRGILNYALQKCSYDDTVESYYWRFMYDSLGNKVRQVDPLNNQTDQEYDVLGRLTTVKLPVISLVLPGTDQLTNFRPTLTYEYDSSGNLITEIKANGNTGVNPGNHQISYEYDQLGRKIKIITKATDLLTGQTVTMVTKNFYDACGNKIRMVDPDNSEWKYVYSARGFLLNETEPAGNTTRYVYDALGNKIAVTDPRRNGVDGKFTTWYLYDTMNRLYRTVLPDDTPPVNPYEKVPNYDNPYIEVTYDPVGNKLSDRDAAGVMKFYSYTPRNWLKQERDNRNSIIKEYIYDKKGNVISTKDALENTFIYKYDSLKRLRQTIDPLGNKENYQYDAVGNRILVENGPDGNLSTRKYSYNPAGKLTKIEDALAQITEYWYDPDGNQIRMIASDNLKTFYQYDEQDRLVERIDSLGNSTKFSYDQVGNRREMHDPRGTKWLYQYYQNNLLKRLDLYGVDGSSYWVDYTYDAAGNRMEVRDNGSSIRYNIEENIYQPDPLNRINRIERSFDGAIYQTAYRYGPNGLLTGIRYPEAQDWLGYRYNDLNQIVEVNGFTTTNGFSYEQDGLLKELIYSNNSSAHFSYDAKRRLTSLNESLNGQNILNSNLTYDEFGNMIGINDRSYQYDKNNQLTKANMPGVFLDPNPVSGRVGLRVGDYLGDSGLDFTVNPQAIVGIDYDSMSIGLDFESVISKIKKIRLIPGKDYQDNRLTGDKFALYLSNDNLNYVKIPQTGWEFIKDSSGTIAITLKTSVNTRYLKLRIKYNNRDNRFRAVNKAQFLNELVKMIQVYQESNSRLEEYEYDARGNRLLFRLKLSQTKEYIHSYYINSNRLKSNGIYAYSYDNTGNLIKKGNRFTISGDQVSFTLSGEGVEYWEYFYDLLGRLIKVTENGTIVSEYAYNPEGLRVVKRAKGETTHYVFEGTEPIFQKNVTTGKIKSYVFAGEKRIARVDGTIGDATAKKYFYHLDHLNNVRAVTDETGKVVYTSDYLAFGSKFGQTIDAGFDEDLGFTGKEMDESGLVYMNARFYNPETGRFLSEDPAQEGLNWYIYCHNNPLIFTDPSGNTPWSANAAVNQYHDQIIATAKAHNISPVLLAAVVYNENVMRTPLHEFKDTVGIALSKYGSDVSLGLCQVQVSNAILLDMGLDPEKFATYSRDEQAIIKKDIAAKMGEGLKEYYINKLEDPLTNLDYAARYLEFLGEARDYETFELWLSDYNRGLSEYETPLPYGDRYDWIIEKYDFEEYDQMEPTSTPSYDSWDYYDYFDYYDYENYFDYYDDYDYYYDDLDYDYEDDYWA